MTGAVRHTSLVYAAHDRKHRPASHPLLAGRPIVTTEDEQDDPLSGWRIRAHRIMRGWSQGDLARRLGVSRPAVAQWESGRNRPSERHVAALRRLLL